MFFNLTESPWIRAGRQYSVRVRRDLHYPRERTELIVAVGPLGSHRQWDRSAQFHRHGRSCSWSCCFTPEGRGQRAGWHLSGLQRLVPMHRPERNACWRLKGRSLSSLSEDELYPSILARYISVSSARKSLIPSCFRQLEDFMYESCG